VLPLGNELFQPAGLHARQMQFLARLLQIFSQRRQQSAQLLQAHRHAATRIDGRIPHRIFRFVRRRAEIQLMLGQRLRHRGQQVVPLSVEFDADFQIERVIVVVFHRLAVPAHRTFQHFERKTRRVLDLEVFHLELGPQRQPACRRVDLQCAGVTGTGKQPCIIGQGLGDVPRQTFGVHAGSEAGAFELLHRGQFFGAAASDLDQLAVAHAPYQWLATATGQTFTGVVERQSRIAQRRRAGGQPRVPGQRVQDQHRLRRQLRAAHIAEYLRQRHPGRQPAARQAAAQAATVLVFQRRQFQPVGFLSRGIEQAHGGALGVEIPQAVDAQQTLTVRQQRQQSLTAVRLHLPVPVELMRLAARQPQSGQSTEKARRGVENLGQQRVTDMATKTRIAAPFAHVLRQPEHGGGEALFVRLQR
jgi:hypothetical protein